MPSLVKRPHVVVPLSLCYCLESWREENHRILKGVERLLNKRDPLLDIKLFFGLRV